MKNKIITKILGGIRFLIFDYIGVHFRVDSTKHFMDKFFILYEKIAVNFNILSLSILVNLSRDPPWAVPWYVLISTWIISHGLFRYILRINYYISFCLMLSIEYKLKAMIRVNFNYNRVDLGIYLYIGFS